MGFETNQTKPKFTGKGSDLIRGNQDGPIHKPPVAKIQKHWERTPHDDRS